jgi:hypothetical protein
MRFSGLLKKACWVYLIMLVVYLVGIGSGFAAGKLKWTDTGKLRTSPVFQLNRNLELRVPVYGPLLQKYKDWERAKLMGHIFKGRVVKAMVLIFFNNWVAADFTMVVRTVTLLPLVLYPYGRFVQGVTLAQAPGSFQVWMVWLTEFGGYFLTICAALSAVLWALAWRRFGFASRGKALVGGLKLFLAAFTVSGVFFFVGAYVETMFLLGASFR